MAIFSMLKKPLCLRFCYSNYHQRLQSHCLKFIWFSDVFMGVCFSDVFMFYLDDWWSHCKIISSYARNSQQLFRVEKRNTTLDWTKKDKHEFRNKAVTVFWHENIVASFLHLIVLFYKVIINHTSKGQFVEFINYIIEMNQINLL